MYKIRGKKAANNVTIKKIKKKNNKFKEKNKYKR